MKKGLLIIWNLFIMFLGVYICGPFDWIHLFAVISIFGTGWVMINCDDFNKYFVVSLLIFIAVMLLICEEATASRAFLAGCWILIVEEW